MRSCIAFLTCIAAAKALCALISRGAIEARGGAVLRCHAAIGRPLLQVVNFFFLRVTGFDIFSLLMSGWM